MEGQNSSSIAYGVASVSAYSINDPENWTSPSIVSELSLHSRQEGSHALAADALPTQRQYNDGSGNIQKNGIRCRLHVVKSSCVSNVGCGWCSSTCIPGNSDGPLLSCDQNAFHYL